MFKGYKLKFEFNAAHSNVENDSNNVHFHTFTMTMYLNILNDEIEYFDSIEREVNEWLNTYRNKKLNETELFMGRSTTLESIGESFFDELHSMFFRRALDLIRLDIYENPIRVYSVSDKILDATVNEIGSLPYAFYGNVAFADEEENAVYCEAENVEAENLEAEAAATEDAEEEIVPIFKDHASTVNIIDENEKKGSRLLFISIYAAILIGLISVGIAIVMDLFGIYPSGSDTYCHLYRADYILKNIKSDNWYPLYDAAWYNGVEVMRYWGPIPLYALALCEHLFGSIFSGYLAYVAGIFAVGAVGFYIVGCKLSRPAMGLFVGIIWFFLPENLKIIFYDGNLPRALINALLPYMIFFVYSYIKDKKVGSLVGLAFMFTIFSLCHIGTTFMLLAVLLAFVFVYSKINALRHVSIKVLIYSLIGILISGLWMIPSLHGSGAGGNNNQVMKNFFQNALKSLDPSYGWNRETVFYFGLSLFLICLFGVIFGTKESAPGFYVGIIFFLLTTESACDIMSRLPFSSFLWMIRFVSMALAFVMFAFLAWKGLRTGVVIILCMLLLVDCFPGTRFIYSGARNERSPKENNAAYASSQLLDQAKAITNQRLAVFDLSGYGAIVPYYVSGVDEKKNYVFGAGWEGARTATNIVAINSSIENGNYYYTFDRCIELGADTALFVIDKLHGMENDIGELIECGNKLGYKCVNRNKYTILFHKETPEQFGVVTTYKNIAIGKSARDIARLYPDFEEAVWDDLSKYSYEELKEYKVIYLGGFSYKNGKKTEELLKKLADNGARIVIDMNTLPINPQTNRQELFGCSVQSITFDDKFPEITYNGDSFKTAGFTDMYKKWKTNYIIGLDNVSGYSRVSNKELAMCGTKDNENIVFLGFNLVYYTEVSKDTEAIRLLDIIFDESQENLPDREIVPVKIEHLKNEINIDSEYDNVNITVADLPDVFKSSTEYRVSNNLIVVDKGHTTISLHYPYFTQGMLVSAFGLLLLIGNTIYLRKHGNRGA